MPPTSRFGVSPCHPLSDLAFPRVTNSAIWRFPVSPTKRSGVPRVTNSAIWRFPVSPTPRSGVPRVINRRRAFGPSARHCHGRQQATALIQPLSQQGLHQCRYVCRMPTSTVFALAIGCDSYCFLKLLNAFSSFSVVISEVQAVSYLTNIVSMIWQHCLEFRRHKPAANTGFRTYIRSSNLAVTENVTVA